MESNKIIFGYWYFQGLAQVSRYLLEYTGLPYTENRYTFETRTQWHDKDKYTLGFDFPNLPYIIDGNFKLTESSAIIRWIPLKAKNSQLLGGNEEDGIKVQTLMGVLYDVWKMVHGTCWGPKENLETDIKTNLGKTEQKLEMISKYLGVKEWLMGYITIADFQLGYVLDFISKMDGAHLEKWKNLQEHYARFFNLEKIKEYVSSDKYNKKFMPPMATWTGPE